MKKKNVQKEDWESTKEWSELSDAIEEIEWDSDDHYDGKIFVIETLKDFIRSQISIARQEEREKMSTFLKEGEDHINALIALAESRARKEFDAMLAEDIAEIQKTIDILPQHKSAYESGVWVALTKAKSILESRRLSLKK